MICSFPGCGRKTLAHGLCDTHNKQKIRRGFLTPIGLSRKKTCSVDGCDENIYGGGMCRKHYRLQKTTQRTKPKRVAHKCLYCGRQAMANGLCTQHIAEKNRFGDIGPRWGTSEPKVCSAPGCVRPAYAKSLCRNHYAKQYRKETQLKKTFQKKV